VTPTPAPTATPSPTPTPIGLVITFIFADGAINPQEPDEYVTIKNTSQAVINLAGWKLKDLGDASQNQSFTFSAGTIQPGQEIRVYTNEVHPESGGYSFKRGGAIWSNCDPDTASLFDPVGNLVSQMSYVKSPGC